MIESAPSATNRHHHLDTTTTFCLPSVLPQNILQLPHLLPPNKPIDAIRLQFLALVKSIATHSYKVVSNKGNKPGLNPVATLGIIFHCKNLLSYLRVS